MRLPSIMKILQKIPFSMPSKHFLIKKRRESIHKLQQCQIFQKNR